MRINVSVNDENSEWFRIFKAKKNIDQDEAINQVFTMARLKEAQK